MSHPEPLSQWMEIVSIHFPRVESSAVQGAGLLELWDGTSQIVWYQPGVCVPGHPAAMS
jgi:hypothetical protein